VSSWVGVVTGSGDAIRNSLTLAAFGATVVCALAFWLGHARARARRAFGVAADVVFIVLFAVPGTIVGVSLIGLWNRAGVAGTVYATNGMFMLRLPRQVHAAGRARAGRMCPARSIVP